MFRIKQVIRISGGIILSGERKRNYIVYPNRELKTTKHFIFVNMYSRVKPGSEVYVPLKTVKGISTVEILGITSGLAALAPMGFTISNLTK